MNALTEHPARREYLASVSAARTLKRLSHLYRRMAAGSPRSAHHMNEANRLREEARFYLAWARRLTRREYIQ